MGKKLRPPHPEHPAVDWSTLELHDGGSRVETTCPRCGAKRWEPAGQVRYRIKRGTYTGYCYKDRLVATRRSDRLPRPEHAAVDWDDTSLETTAEGRRRTRVRVTCPKCKEPRWGLPGSIAAKLRQGGFTGECLACSRNAPKREWISLGLGRKLDPNKGYVRLNKAVAKHPDMWDAISGGRPFVLEHRYVLSVQLGRPLTPDEFVDHIDGDKTNNDPSNLRIYRRGHNDPGNMPGYGTFYDEWQRAEARIRELEATIEGFTTL